MVQTVFSLSVGILLLVLIVFNDKFVTTSARTYSLAEDGSLQIEGYSVNTVFGNLTAVHDWIDENNLNFFMLQVGLPFR